MDEFVCYNFVVDERPVAAWSLSLADDNDRFLQGLQPDFFSAHIEEKTQAVISDSDPAAALHLRLLYGHALETLFALVGAAVQAPECAAPWVLAYRTNELRRVVEGISRGELRYRRMEGPVSWENVSNRINRVEVDDPEQEAWIRSGFADAWSRFAIEFVGEGFADEQNSLKHGLRVVPGGFSLTLREKEEAGGDLGRIILDSTSTFGSRFFVRKRLDKHNFSLVESARNWNPQAMSAGLELLAISIGNVVSYLRLHAGVDGPSAGFRWPVGPTDAFDLPFQTDFLIREMSGGRVLQLSDVVVRSATEILASYADDDLEDSSGGV